MGGDGGPRTGPAPGAGGGGETPGKREGEGGGGGRPGSWERQKPGKKRGVPFMGWGGKARARGRAERAGGPWEAARKGRFGIEGQK